MAISDYTIGKPFDNYSRRDLYLPTGNLNLVSVQSSWDITPIYPHWQDGKYNEHCACCWLGHTHSELRHDTAVARRIKELVEHNARVEAIIQRVTQ